MSVTVLYYDNLTSSNLQFRQRIRDWTEFQSLQLPLEWNQIHTNNLKKSLVEASNYNQQWVFIIALGHFVRSEKTFHQMIREMEQQDVPMRAHIIMRPGEYPSVDPQFICLNLERWKQAGCVPFEIDDYDDGSSIESATVERSEENFHNDYTPRWIRLQSGTSLKYNRFSDQFGWRVVRSLLNRGFTIENFDEDVRANKIHLYPNSNFDLLYYFMQTGRLLPATLKNRAGRYELQRTIFKQYSALRNSVYPINTESTLSNKHYTLDGPVDNLIGVASGLKLVMLLYKLKFHKNTEVTFIDISLPGLQYQQYLKNNWDGDFANYWEVFDTFQKSNPRVEYSRRYWLDWDEEIKLTLEQEKITPAQFKTHWQEYQKLPVNFLTTNLIEDFSVVLEKIKTGKRNYIWISNALDMDWSRMMLGKDYVVKRFYQLLDNLEQTQASFNLESQNILYDGSSPIERTNYDRGIVNRVTVAY